MGDVSRHFSRSEFACKCGCGFQAVDTELLRVLEDVRENFQQPITVSSGCRCYRYNQKVGGAEHSQHVFGTAADIVVKDVLPSIVSEYLEERYPEKYGIGRYPRDSETRGWTHIDIRTKKARWIG